MATTSSMSRRDLLKGGGSLLVCFGFTRLLPSGDGSQARADSGGEARSTDPSHVDGFLAVHADGTVTLFTGKVDIGTGLRIALAQMAAEELGVEPSRIQVIDGDTGRCPNQNGTGGSNGLTQGGLEIRRAAATARKVLLEMAAGQLHRPAGDLILVRGEVRARDGGPALSIASLVGNRRFAVSVDPNAALADPSMYAYIGLPLPRPDVAEKCAGRYLYVQDFTLPGLLHGRVIRPPAIGATIVSVDESSVRHIPGVRVVRIDNFLGVVAEDEWAAVRGAAELTVRWTTTRTLPGHASLERHVRESPVERDQAVVAKGDPHSALRDATMTVSSTFFWPCQSHAPLGPSCAVADVRGDEATIWSSTQDPHDLQANLAKVFALQPEKTRVVFLEGSGSYGTSGFDYAAADAVLLSKTVAKPVRVQWSREDELRWDPKGPPQLLDVRAGLDGAGRIVAWDVEMWVPATRPGPRAFLAADAAGIAQEHGRSSGLLTLNADPPYDVDHVRVLAHWLKDTPLVPSNLRAPGKIANVFAVESVIDELAAARRMDPLAFRLERLHDPRAVEVLTRAARAIDWRERPSPNPEARRTRVVTGRGIAYVRYKQRENYVAIAMAVSVNPADGRIVVDRVTCAHDCGLVVNPDGLKNQIEGCIVQTLSRALHEEVVFDASRVTSDTWATYPILRFPEAPAIEVVLIDRPDQPLMGAGEAACTPVAAALANAIFDATGVRLRTVPFTPERVKAALAHVNRPG